MHASRFVRFALALAPLAACGDPSAATTDDAVVAPVDALAPPPDAPASDAFAPPDAPDVLVPDALVTDALTLPDALATDAPAPDAAVALPACDPPPSCTPPSIALDPTVPWNHTLVSAGTVLLGSARHRGRDLYLRVGDPQWALAKFAYGAIDKALSDESVDIFETSDCTTWHTLGRATTTTDGTVHPTVEGVADDSGRVYFPIPDAMRLGVGWHRLRLVVRGDHTFAEQWIRVFPEGARWVVSDVDGTLTTDENAQFTSLLTGTPPNANTGSPEALSALAARGYEVMYLTARPEWLEPTTHSWLDNHGYPRGIVHTTLGFTGATGAPAQSFKTAELLDTTTRFRHVADYGFGNTITDVGAYTAAGIEASHAYFFRFTTDPASGTTFDDYVALVAGFRALGAVCR